MDPDKNNSQQNSSNSETGNPQAASLTSDGKNSNRELDDAKKKALEALAPLLGELKNISPERRFDICMNALRFTDDKLIASKALEAALQIEEKGTKAEALVELINEINYLQQA